MTSRWRARIGRFVSVPRYGYIYDLSTLMRKDNVIQKPRKSSSSINKALAVAQIANTYDDNIYSRIIRINYVIYIYIYIFTRL